MFNNNQGNPDPYEYNVPPNPQGGSNRFGPMGPNPYGQQGNPNAMQGGPPGMFLPQSNQWGQTPGFDPARDGIMREELDEFRDKDEFGFGGQGQGQGNQFGTQHSHQHGHHHGHHHGHQQGGQEGHRHGKHNYGEERFGGDDSD